MCELLEHSSFEHSIDDFRDCIVEILNYWEGILYHQTEPGHRNPQFGEEGFNIDLFSSIEKSDWWMTVSEIESHEDE